MRRPMQSWSADELRQVANCDSADIDLMLEVLKELRFRTSRLAKSVETEVRRKVRERLAGQLETLLSLMPEPPSKSPQPQSGDGCVESRIRNLAPVRYQHVADDESAFGLHEAPAQGVLSSFGYRVGDRGLDRSDRRQILRGVLKYLPDDLPSEYLNEWGPPSSHQRYVKLMRTLSSFVENALRKKSPPQEAIREWRDDIAWLRRYVADNPPDY